MHPCVHVSLPFMQSFSLGPSATLPTPKPKTLNSGFRFRGGDKSGRRAQTDAEI